MPLAMLTPASLLLLQGAVWSPAARVGVARMCGTEVASPTPATVLHERVNVAHILVASEELARLVVEKLEESSFFELAESVSQCESAAVGGELGWLSRGLMVPQFDGVAFRSEVRSILSLTHTHTHSFPYVTHPFFPHPGDSVFVRCSLFLSPSEWIGSGSVAYLLLLRCSLSVSEMFSLLCSLSVLLSLLFHRWDRYKSSNLISDGMCSK